MPVCWNCGERYFTSNMGGPSEPCECGTNESVEDRERDARRDYEPTEDELESTRAALKPLR